MAEAAIDVGADMIGMVKINMKRLGSDIIEKMKKYWIGDSYLILKRNSTSPKDRLIIDIVSKYNIKKVLYFIDTENSSITNAGIRYLYRQHNPFYNVSILSVYFPLFVS